jgi:hypothetical protein
MIVKLGENWQDYQSLLPWSQTIAPPIYYLELDTHHHSMSVIRASRQLEAIFNNFRPDFIILPLILHPLVLKFSVES